MAFVGPAFKNSLDCNPSNHPVLGDGYKVEIWSRSAVRYSESERRITMFSDLVERCGEPYRVHSLWSLLNRLISKWCLGVYIEEPLVWDDETAPIPPDHARLILQRTEDALKQRSGCYRIDRGPNQQHSHSNEIKDNFFKHHVRW